MKILLFLILGLIFSLALCQNGNKPFKLIRMSQENGAKCQDGSAPTLHFREGSGENKDKFIFYFQGGGWCQGTTPEETLDHCVDRIENFFINGNHYGSSNYQKDERIFDGINNGDPTLNPYFYNYNIVRVNYCDGTGHQGYAEKPVIHKGQEVWFRGQANTEEAFNYTMNVLGMKNASQVIIGGYSAGGLACFTWIDELKLRIENVNQKTEVVGYCDCGIFMNFEHMQSKTLYYKSNIQNFMAFSNINTPPVNRKCAAAYPGEWWKCMFAQYLLEFVETRTLITQPQYDTWILRNIAGLREECVKYPDDIYTEICTQDEFQQAELYRKEYMTKIFKLIENKPNLGIWTPACLIHCFNNSSEFYDKTWAIPSGSGQTVDKTLHEFVSEGKLNVIYDKDSYPSNFPCSRLTQEEKIRFANHEEL